MVILNKTKLLYLMLFVLASCQSGNSRTHALDLDVESISNEVDYRFVFDRIEDQIKIAPNRIIDPELQNYLVNLTCELSKKYCLEIRIYILNQPYFNAHMLPNGALILNSGLLLRIDNQAQLAYILSHEVAHYIYKHGIKKINRNKLVSKSDQVGDSNPFKAISRFSNIITKNKYSQRLEHEADIFSIKVLSRNNIPITETARLFENLWLERSVANRANRGGFLSSHPGTKQRIKLFKNNTLEKPVTNKMTTENSWETIKTRFLNDWLHSELRKREFESTLVLLNQLKTDSDNPGYYDFYLGEIYRKQAGKENTQTAISYYLNHLDSNKNDKVISVYKHLAQAYMDLGMPGKAKLYYAKYINQNPLAPDLNIIKEDLNRIEL